jgi:hypothetical protein
VLDHTQIDYRTCFSSEVGRRVLSHLLIEAGLFDNDLKTPEELAVENYAKGILKNMGLFGDPTKVQPMVNGIINVQV